MIDIRIKYDPTYRATLDRKYFNVWGVYRRSAVPLLLHNGSDPSGSPSDVFATGATPLRAYGELLRV